MQKTYINPIYPYQKSVDHGAKTPAHHTVVIIGAGPSGLSLALDLALQGIKTVVLDDNNTVSVGSRAICFSKRTLEIMNGYGCADKMVNKGITWREGRVFFQNEQVYNFNLLPENGHKLPAFINLQQYYFEQYLVEQCQTFAEIDLRWKNKVITLDSQANINYLSVDTPDGQYQITADYVLAADGANSQIRAMLGLESKGQVFQDRFLIADVVMKADFPTERWFWFDPPFNKNQSALLHRQADDVWRIDLQLGWDADPEYEKQEAVVRPRIEAMLGSEIDFELEWSSVYTFQCRRMDDFIHQQVIFVGDAAHQVSPFGARGANGAIQSVENLAWKLARILKKQAPKVLLNTYQSERLQAADENIVNSTRSTDFITPKNNMSRVFRDEVLRLSKDHPFARTLVNSGRLSLPCCYCDSPLNTPEQDKFDCDLSIGDVFKDAELKSFEQDENRYVLATNKTWLLDHLGKQFTLMVNIDVDDKAQLMTQLLALTQHHDLAIVLITKESQDQMVYHQQFTLLFDEQALLAQRYQLTPASAYLFRPDQVITGRWQQFTVQHVEQAINKALGFALEY